MKEGNEQEGPLLIEGWVKWARAYGKDGSTVEVCAFGKDLGGLRKFGALPMALAF